MRFWILRVVPLALIAVAVGSCSSKECTPGEMKPDSTCYTGPDGTAGKGICKAGHFTCQDDGTWGSTCDGQVVPATEVCNGLDDDCNGQTDEGLLNTCGGCKTLTNLTGQPAQPGDVCGNCRVFACDGSEALRCLSTAETVGSACSTPQGCAGSYACDVNGKVTCDGPTKNACGRCDGPEIEHLGETCLTVPEGCNGTFVCNGTNDGTVCVGEKQNNCGVCGQPDVALIGHSCQAANGCAGTYQCDVANPGQAACVTTMIINECGVCVPASTPAMDPNVLPGGQCTAPGTKATGGGCGGHWKCDPSGLRTICDAPPRNNCGGCGMPNVDGLNTDCVGLDGCTGKWKCDTDPANEGQKACLNTLGFQPKKNECNVCNAAAVPAAQLAGTTATYSYTVSGTTKTCPSLYLCKTDGSTAIQGLMQNACGLCANTPASTATWTSPITAPLTGSAPGGPCTAAAPNDCPGTYTCKADMTGTQCTTTQVKNLCGKCNGPSPLTHNIGDPCTTTEGCSTGASWQCDMATGGTGDATKCVGPVKNQCGLCGGPALPTKGNACTLPNTCASTLGCNATNDALVCTPVATNNCGACGQPDVTGLGTACTNSTTGCNGTYACAANKTSTTCQAPTKNNCNVCGDPYGDVQGIGDACFDSSSGCASTQVCVPDTSPGRTGFMTAGCQPTPKNACGKCGGTAIPANQQPNTACTGTSNCSGTWTCATDKQSTSCNAPAKNNCRVCGAADVPGIGDACTDLGGCQSSMICWGTSPNFTARCATLAKNECGVCNVTPSGHTIGSTCGSGACTGSWACVNGGFDIVCDGCIASHLVISEMSLAGSGASDSFVEIYNPTAAAVAIGGFSLWYANATGTFSKLDDVPASTNIGAGKFYLFANTAMTSPAPDRTYAQALATAGGSVWLVSTGTQPTGTGDASVVDLLGWGTSTLFEGAVAPAPATGSSLERKAISIATAADMEGGEYATIGNGYDSGSNSADFVTRVARQPQNSASTAETRQ